MSNMSTGSFTIFPVRLHDQFNPVMVELRLHNGLFEFDVDRVVSNVNKSLKSGTAWWTGIPVSSSMQEIPVFTADSFSIIVSCGLVSESAKEPVNLS